MRERWPLFVSLTKSEKGQDQHDHNDQADEIDDTVHGLSPKGEGVTGRRSGGCIVQQATAFDTAAKIRRVEKKVASEEERWQAKKEKLEMALRKAR